MAYCFLLIIYFYRVLNEDDNTTEIKSPEPKNLIAPIVKKTTGGLANVLTQIGKKNKLTVLEKSKQDWDSYKKKEGIVEELITHNKGKDGFVFLIDNIHCEIYRYIGNLMKTFLVIGF